MSLHELRPVEELDNAMIWDQAMGAAAKAFAKGDTQTGIAKVVYASWLAATTDLHVSRPTATAVCSLVNDAAGTFNPPGSAA